jgi:hypothetical protein
MSMETPKTANIEDGEIARIKDLIMKLEDYPHTSYAREQEHQPYVLDLESEKKKLVYFGSPHINNPEDVIFDEIKKKFEETKPEMVYIEGWRKINFWKDKIREDMKDESLEDMKTKGESKYALKLAVDAGADFESPEPDLREEIEWHLKKGFSKHDIFSYYMYRTIDQYQRMHKEQSREDCEKYLAIYLDHLFESVDWSKEEFEFFKQDLFKNLEVENTKKYHDQVHPIPWEGLSLTNINMVSQSSNRFRDEYAVERIAEGLKKYDRMFVVYGASHAVILEPALRALMENK